MKPTGPKHVWSLHIRSPRSKPGKQGEPTFWTVQVNEIGEFRCNCPDYIFGSKRRGEAVKNCKHTRWSEQEARETSTHMPMALEIVELLVNVGGLAPVATTAKQRMAAALISRVFTEETAAHVYPQAMRADEPEGFRLITFEGD